MTGFTNKLPLLCDLSFRKPCGCEEGDSCLECMEHDFSDNGRDWLADMDDDEEEEEDASQGEEQSQDSGDDC